MVAKKSKLKTGAGIVLMVIVARLLLPVVVLYYANKKLASMNGYYGHVKDIDIALLRGAYQLDTIYLNKVDTISQKQTPFFSATTVDLSIEWKALFSGSIVGEFVVDSPVLIFTREKVELSTLERDSSYFKKLKDDFMPLRVNRLEVKNGNIRYRDNGSKPTVDIAMTNTFLIAENLRNAYDSSVLLPAKVAAQGSIYDGSIELNIRFNPLSVDPAFDMNASWKNTDLVQLNDFFQAYADLDVNNGTFGMYAEAAGKNGNFAGYVKPLIKDLDILGKEDRDDNLLQQIWEALVGAAGQVFKNQEHDQVATKVPLAGKLENPDTNVWFAIATILRNAFIQALQPSIDHEITIESVDKNAKKRNGFIHQLMADDDGNDNN